MVSPHEAEHLKDEVKQLMDLDGDESHEDDFQLMLAWEARHHVKVAREVRRLAERLPALELFEWYPGGPCVNVLWKWKIHRTGHGKNSAVRMVSGNLSWEKCATGNPPSMPALVGQELAYYEDRYDRDARHEVTED
jgi:hypothetical protein